MAIQTVCPKYRSLRGRADGSPLWSSRLTFLAAPPPIAVPVFGLGRDIRVQVASSRSDWEEALRLVADNYQARGYEAPDAADFRFTSYQALPDSVTLVAKERDWVVATLSLVFDNTLLGLPIEGLYQCEVRQRRKTGARLAEAGNLAARDLGVREFPAVFLALIRLAMQYHASRAGGSWAWVITVNPRHRCFYAKMLGFVPLGPWRAYPAVRGHPAEAYYLDDSLMKSRAPLAYRQVFAEPLPPEALRPVRMPVELVRYFGAHSSQTDRRFVEEIQRYVAEFGNPSRW